MNSKYFPAGYIYQQGKYFEFIPLHLVFPVHGIVLGYIYPSTTLIPTHWDGISNNINSSGENRCFISANTWYIYLVLANDITLANSEK